MDCFYKDGSTRTSGSAGTSECRMVMSRVIRDQVDHQEVQRSVIQELTEYYGFFWSK
jgi:hypothetical protein